MIDLHTHSSASDSDLSPAQLIQEAVKLGISAIALTDHDTLGGLESAKNEAKTAGIHFIPGIEISIAWTGESGIGPNGEMHLLGLGVSSPSPAFISAVASLSSRREKRNREILGRMHELGMEATWDELLAMSDGDSLGRPHFASLLIAKKIVRDREQAFTRYLRPGKPLFVPKTGLDFTEACALISESGGIPVLAHPMSLYVAWGRLPDLIKTMKNRGLKGIKPGTQRPRHRHAAAWKPLAIRLAYTSPKAAISTAPPAPAASLATPAAAGKSARLC